MRKIKLFLIIIVLSICFLSCNNNNNKEKRFTIIHEQGNDFTLAIKIIQDNKTGIKYLFVKKGFDAGLTEL